MARLRHIAVVVKDLGKAAAFYSQVFEFKKIGREDLVETQMRIEANGGKFFFDLGNEREGNLERKFKDPDGVIFDISKHGWHGTDGYSQK